MEWVTGDYVGVQTNRIADTKSGLKQHYIHRNYLLLLPNNYTKKRQYYTQFNEYYENCQAKHAFKTQLHLKITTYFSIPLAIVRSQAGEEVACWPQLAWLPPGPR